MSKVRVAVCVRTQTVTVRLESVVVGESIFGDDFEIV